MIDEVSQPAPSPESAPTPQPAPPVAAAASPPAPPSPPPEPVIPPEAVKEISTAITEGLQEALTPEPVTPSLAPTLPPTPAETPTPAADPPVPAAAPAPSAPHQSAGAHMRQVVRSRKQARLDKVMTLVGEKHVIVNDDVEKRLGVSNATATRYLNELVKAGRLKRFGARRHEKYELPGASNSAI